MEVTLSIDDETLARIRDLADRRGTSVDQLIRSYLEDLASDRSDDRLAEKLTDLWATSSGNSGGRTWTREEIHERTGVR